jgi:hypothetical protein
MDWIDLAQDRDQSRAIVNKVMNLRIPQNAQKWTIGSFSRRAQIHEVSYMVDKVKCVDNFNNQLYHPSYK